MELAPIARQRFFDNNGLPLAGGLLYTYDAGTTTPKATYLDRSGTANTNPIVLDANGYCDVWLDSGFYKLVLKDSLGNTLWTKDQVSLPDEAAIASAFWRDVVYLTSADSPRTLTQTDNGKLLSVDTSSGAVVVNLPQISLTALPFNIGFKLSNATNTLTINRAGTDTIEGATSKTMAALNASCQLIADIDKSPDQWATLDFGVVDFSTFTLATPDSTDFVPIVDTSAGSTNKKASYRNFKNAVLRSVITTDSVGVDDETMILSGASFTSTLPAIGSTTVGKRYKFIHNGTSLTQIFTIASGSNTIGGVASGSFKLYTKGEILEVEDPGTGTDWPIVGRFATAGQVSSGSISLSATSAYTFTITSATVVAGDTYTNNGQTFQVTTSGTVTSMPASGTGAPGASGTLTRASGSGPATLAFSGVSSSVPAFAGVTSNFTKWRRYGEFAHITYGLFEVSGTAGSGDYVIYLPTGLVLDSSYTPYLASVGSFFAGNDGVVPATIATNGAYLYQAGAHYLNNPILPAAYSTSSFRVATVDNTPSSINWGSGTNFAFSSGAAISFSATIVAKISGWQP